ncbi:MAG: chromate resistance protein [Acidobacteria bacterium]|nr:chromate resistance protein [Acidobacteriota bacterium]
MDRMGSAWLIKRFIDPEARFGFVDQPPSSGTAIPFDMFGVEFTHRGEWCTFETLVRTFAITDAAVCRLAGIVHDLDLKDARFGAPEAAAVGAMVEGLQVLYADDHALLEQGITMFEALYRSFERAARPAGPRPVAGRQRKSSTRATRQNQCNQQHAG